MKKFILASFLVFAYTVSMYSSDTESDEDMGETFQLLRPIPLAPIWKKQDYRNDNDQLIQAAQDGNIQEVKDLLAAGADVNSVEFLRMRPIHYAAKNGDAELVKLLVDAGANVNKVNMAGNTPLHLAAEKGHTQIVKLLLDAGADVNDVNNAPDRVDMWCMSPLNIAAEKGHTQTLKLLLDAGADVNNVDFVGRTPLLSAAYNGHTQIVQVLLAHDACINEPDNLIRLAVEESYFEVIPLLQAVQKSSPCISDIIPFAMPTRGIMPSKKSDFTYDADKDFDMSCGSGPAAGSAT